MRLSPSRISIARQAGLTPSPPPSLKLWRSRRLRSTSWSKHSGSGFASVQNASDPSPFFNVKRRGRRAWKANDSFPEAVEAEEELDFLAPEEGADGFHGALAAGALEGVAASAVAKGYGVTSQTLRMRSRQRGRMSQARLRG